MAKFTTEYIFDTATSTVGMKKNDIVLFHLHNPNGLVNKLPDFEDFVYGETFFAGCEVLYSRHSNYYAEWLRNAVRKPHTYTRTQLLCVINNLEKEVVKAWETLKLKKAAA